MTDHELPARIELLEQHWNGQRYRICKNLSEYDFTQHEPYLVPHKRDPHLLWCTLTSRPVSRQPKAVEGHVSGKRFKRLLAEEKSKSAAREVAEGAEEMWEGDEETCVQARERKRVCDLEERDAENEEWERVELSEENIDSFDEDADHITEKKVTGFGEDEEEADCEGNEEVVCDLALDAGATLALMDLPYCLNEEIIENRFL